jgi:hypothetical protein
VILETTSITADSNENLFFTTATALELENEPLLVVTIPPSLFTTEAPLLYLTQIQEMPKRFLAASPRRSRSRPSMPLSSREVVRLRSQQDLDVLRGAAMIRSHIQTQLEHPSSLHNEQQHQMQMQHVYDEEHVYDEPPDDEEHHPVLTSASTQDPDQLYAYTFCDDFSDPWDHVRQKAQQSLMKTTEASDESENESLQRDDCEPVRGESRGRGGSMTMEAYEWSPVGQRRRPASESPPPPPPPDDDTPVSYMGRGKVIKMKTHTYLVQPYEMLDDYDFVEDDYVDDELAARNQTDESRVPSLVPPIMVQCEDMEKQPHPYRQAPSRNRMHDEDEDIVMVDTSPRRFSAHKEISHSSTPQSHSTASTARSSETSPGMVSHHHVVPPSPPGEVPKRLPNYHFVVSPLSPHYNMLLQDPAYLHAQNAGTLWQSLVGHQLRFPTHWWNGARAPPLGDPTGAPWEYLGRYPIRNEPLLQSLVHNRASAGRILLHILVRDAATGQSTQDIVVGCFHPNARGIRRTPQANPYEETCRDLWVGVRKRHPGVSVLDHLFCLGQPWHGIASKGPLGPKQKVTNANVRVVFGDKPPVETVLVTEDDLYERMTNLTSSRNANPPLLLLQEFVFS